MRLSLRRRKQDLVERGGYSAPLPWDQYQGFFTYNNNVYPFGLNTTIRGDREEISPTYAGLIQGAYLGNGVVYACMMLRQLVFSEARFQWQELRNGRPGNLFGSPELAILEQPGQNQTTRDLLRVAIMDADLAGNWYGLRDGDVIRRLRPDWVSIVMGSSVEPDNATNQWDTELVGYLYHAGGDFDKDPVAFDAREVAHFAPSKDPRARFRGMSWLTPVIREISADTQATQHKDAFFTQGATPNMVIKIPESVRKEAADQWVEGFRRQHEGAANAYKTLIVGGGMDTEIVGTNFQQMDFKSVQGAGETRIAAAARVHPVVVGLSEGLQGSSLNAGNFGAARRSTADTCFIPLWGDMASSLQTIVRPPNSAARLWYDGRDIAFLREDELDAANIQNRRADTIARLIREGFKPESVVDAIESDDFSRLQHTGLVSVQLQPPGTTAPEQNGNGTVALPSALKP